MTALSLNPESANDLDSPDNSSVASGDVPFNAVCFEIVGPRGAPVVAVPVECSGGEIIFGMPGNMSFRDAY